MSTGKGLLAAAAVSRFARAAALRAVATESGRRQQAVGMMMLAMAAAVVVAMRQRAIAATERGHRHYRQVQVRSQPPLAAPVTAATAGVQQGFVRGAARLELVEVLEVMALRLVQLQRVAVTVPEPGQMLVTAAPSDGFLLSALQTRR